MVVEERVNSSESKVKPCLAALASLACQFLQGAILGQSSTMLLQLRDRDSPIQIDDESASWIASTGIIGTPISALLCGPLTDKLGRKSVLRMHLLLTAVGHVIVGVSNDISEILIGRFILSIAAGFAVPALVYISEICNPTHRGFLLSSCGIAASLGLLYVYTLGMIINWDMASLITSSLATLSLFYSFFIPESPAWLFQNHRLNETIESLKWLKGETLNVETELKALKDSCQEKPTLKQNTLREFLQPTVYKPFFVLLIFPFLQNGTGFYILLYYSVDFLKAFQTSLDPQLLTIILGISRLVSVSISSSIMNKYRRKSMGVFSGVGGVIILGIILFYLIMFQNNASVLAQYAIIPAICLTLYVFACGMGIHPLPWIMIFELYPLNVRGLMCGVSFAVNYVFTFIFIKSFYFFVNNLKIQGTVLMFLVFCGSFCLFCLFVLPETKSKTLIEIEKSFESKKGKKEITTTVQI